MREKISFNSGWLFHKGEIERPYPMKKGPIYTYSKTERELWGAASRRYNDRADGYNWNEEMCTDDWDTVTLPHDFTITETPSEENNVTLGFLPQGNAWYRKHFKLSQDDENKRICLYFEAVSTNATVWINGCMAGRHFGGATPFLVDITNFVEFEQENVVAVYVENSNAEGWWYSGGGIYRSVYMIKTEKVSVDLYGVYINPQKQSDDNWDVPVEICVRNDSVNNVQVKLTAEIIDRDGKSVATAGGDTGIAPFSQSAVTVSMSVSKPHLWDCDNPNMYSVVTRVFVGTEQVDEVSDRFGFRTLTFDPNNGFFLNGKHTVIKGVCCHQDYGITGKAVPERVQRYRLKIMREMGANGYRTAHYPHSEYTMDCLDELGFLVMDETRWFSTCSQGSDALVTMVKRDRNHPCVVYWSMGNEEPICKTEKGRRIAEQQRETIKHYDTTRPVTMALYDGPSRDPVAGELDVIGINYALNHYDILHEKYPQKPIVGSECCATGTTRGWYYDADMKRGYFPAYDTDICDLSRGREQTWHFFMSHPYAAGYYQWAGIEHRGESGFWPRISSVSGAVDMFLQKKDAFYQNRSFWTDTPMIHILPKWNFPGKDGDEIRVWAYTNCEEAELLLNGKSLGRVKVEKYGHAEWMVAYTPGKLEAVGYNGGKTVTADCTETPGRPAKLKFCLEDDGVGVNDYAILTCYCTDTEGRVVTDACPTVDFYCNKLGVIAGSGGSNTDHVPPQSPQRKLWMGCCSVLVATGKQSGVLQVTAKSDGLETAVLNIEI